MKYQLLLTCLLIQLANAADETTRFNPDFDCDGCILITTDESLQGTVSEGPTTITTFTPPIATSVVEPTTRDPDYPDTAQPDGPDTTPPPSGPDTTSPTFSLPDETSTPSDEFQPPVITTATPNQPGDVIISTVTPHPYLSTILIGEQITRTYRVSTTTALVLLVTETTTWTEVETITVNQPYVDYEVLTSIIPISTYTTTSNAGRGYMNITDIDEYYKEYLTTEYSTYETTVNRVKQRESLSYIARVFQKVITSTLIVWGDHYTEGYEVENGYRTVVSTIYPGTYVTTLSTIQPPVSPPVVTTTITYTETTTPVAPIIPPSYSTDVCGVSYPVAAAEDGEFTIEIFSGLAGNRLIPNLVYLSFLLPMMI